MKDAALQGGPPPHHPMLPPARCERAPVKAPMRREWPSDYWDELLMLRGLPRSRQRKADLPPERRGWAFDLPRRSECGSANAPKRWVAAEVDAFVDVYMELGPQRRHAYELLEATRGCHLFFDLDGRSDGTMNCDEIAGCVAEEAAGVLRDLVAARAPAEVAAAGVTIKTLSIDSAHGGEKFSRHLLLQALAPDGCVAAPRCVLAGLGCAYAAAAHVVARCERRGMKASALVDFAVYRAGGLLRLLGSSKLAGEARAPLRLNVEHSSAAFAALSPRELLSASLVQPACGGEVALTCESHAPPRAPPPVQPPPVQPPPSVATGSTVAEAEPPDVAPLVQPHERRRWAHLTARPLLETPRLVPHRLRAPRRSGRGAPPAPLDRLGRWGAAQLRRLGCLPRGGGIAAAGPGAVVQQWLALALEGEWMLRLIPYAGGRCACIGRPHRSRQIVLTIDLRTGEAYQQCLDVTCREPRNGGYVAASAFVGVAAAGSCLPCPSAIEEYLTPS